MKTAGAYCQWGTYSSLVYIFVNWKGLLPDFFLDLISFQFVVSDSGDYTIHAMDPDVLVEWDLIEQVVSVFLHYILHIIQLVSTWDKMLVAMKHFFE